MMMMMRTRVMNLSTLRCSWEVGWRRWACWCYAAVEQLDDGDEPVEQLDDGDEHVDVTLQSSRWTMVMNMLMLRCSRWWTCWHYAAVGDEHVDVTLQSVMNMLMLRCSRWWTCWRYAAVEQLDDGDDDDEPIDIRLQSSSWTMVTTVMNMLTLGCSRSVRWGGGGWRRCTCWHQAARQTHASAAKPAATTAATTGRVVQVSPSLVAVVVAMSGWSGDTRTRREAS